MTAALTPTSGGLTLSFEAPFPGRYVFEIEATDDAGNTTLVTEGIEVYYPAGEHPFELVRGIGSGVIVPGEPDFYPTYIDALVAMNASLLQINVHGRSEGLNSSVVTDCPYEYDPDRPCETGSPDQVALLIGLAHDAGLEVMLKLHIVPGTWLNPTTTA